MSGWVTIGRICVSHEYTNSGNMVELVATEHTVGLMKRRGLLFRKLSPGRWEWLAPREDFHGLADGDELMLSMRVCSPHFFLYTVCDGYDPGKVYRIAVEGGGELDVMSSLRPIDGEAKRCANEFCRIVWSPRQKGHGERQLLPDMESCDVLMQFRSRSSIWEYFFIFRNPDEGCGPRLVLEDASRRISFGPPEAQKDGLFGRNVWRIASLEPVQAFEQDEYHLILSEVIQSVPPKKRTIARFLPSPQPGRFLSNNEGAIRHICYI